MNKPTIAELLNASGHTTYAPDLVMRAIFTLYGNIGAGLDERDWASIMASTDPLGSAEAALLAMYQNPGYLLRNLTYLVNAGHVPAEAEITYRQMYDRLGLDYTPSWSVGTPYQNLGTLNMDQLNALVPVQLPPALPTLTVNATATGFALNLNVAGKVEMTGGPINYDLGNFSAGTAVLGQQFGVKEGFLQLTANGNTSAATSQYVVLGTGNHDSIFTAQATNRVDYIDAGAGDDFIDSGTGNDTIFGGAGNDTILLTGGDNRVGDAGVGSDFIVALITPFAGSNTIQVTGTDMVRVRNDSGSMTVNITNGIRGNVVVEGFASGTALPVTVNGGDGDDLVFATGIGLLGVALNGGAGSDQLTGSPRGDTLSGGLGADLIIGNGGTDLFVVNSALESRVATIDTAPAGFDLVAVNPGDLFDFKLAGLSVYTPVHLTNEAIATSGSDLIAQLNAAYLNAGFNDGSPNVAMAVKFLGGQTFLAVDTSGDGAITGTDAVVQLLGSVSMLGYNAGLVTVNPNLVI